MFVRTSLENILCEHTRHVIVFSVPINGLPDATHAGRVVSKKGKALLSGSWGGCLLNILTPIKNKKRVIEWNARNGRLNNKKKKRDLIVKERF